MAWVLPNLHWEWWSRSDLADEEGGSSTSKTSVSSPHPLQRTPRAPAWAMVVFQGHLGGTCKKATDESGKFTLPDSKDEKRALRKSRSVYKPLHIWLDLSDLGYPMAGLDTGDLRGRDRSLRDARMSSPASDQPMWMCYSSLGVCDKQMFVYETLLLWIVCIDMYMHVYLSNPISCWFQIPVSCSSWSPKVHKFPSLKPFIFPNPALRRAQGFKVFPIKYRLPQGHMFLYMMMYDHVSPYYRVISHMHVALSENREVPLNHSKSTGSSSCSLSNCSNLGTLRLGYNWFVKRYMHIS